MIATRVAVLLDRYQPGRTLSSIEASAGLPAASLTGWVDWIASARPAAPVSMDTMRRIAAAIGATPSVVSHAFAGIWYDSPSSNWCRLHAENTAQPSLERP